MTPESNLLLPVIKPSEWDEFGVGAFMTTRGGGVSRAPYGDIGDQPGLNLGFHVADSPEAVRENQSVLSRHLPVAPLWLNQVHGNVVYRADGTPEHDRPFADAAVTDKTGLVLAILTADCLPVLFVDPVAGVIGAAHGGWRGLLDGVLPRTIGAMTDLGAEPGRIQAWLGAAIGPRCFEVGPEVPEAFVRGDASMQLCFKPHPERSQKWFGDLHQIARRQLAAAGVGAVSANTACTVEDRRFYSFRRDGVCGRMASLIWLL